jgi:hypothetical protein
MSSTVGGDDETHDLSTEEKDKLEKKLRAEARALMRTGAKKPRNALLKKADEISRRKSKRADHH